eukprot:10745035-Alexandrium_andersonii.AAC.1
MALHASADQCPRRGEGPSPAGERAVQPRCGTAQTTASAPNMPQHSAVCYSDARSAGTTAVLTLHLHGSCHSCQPIQGARRARVAVLAP